MALNIPITWSSNTKDLTADLKEGINVFAATSAAAEKMAQTLGGDKLLRAANLYAQGLTAMGEAGGVVAGAERLIASERDRGNTILDKAIAKYEALGQTAPAAILAASAAIKAANTETTSWLSGLNAMGSSWVARIAEGILLRDAIHEVIDVVKEGILAFPEMVKHTVEVGNSLYEMSLKTGASVENLSALRYVAGQTGIDFTSFGTTLYKMEQALGSTGAKADALQGHLNLLHLNLKTLKDEKPDQAFIDILSALEQLPNRADQAAAGMAIFGKGFKEMAGLTQESITALMTEAKDLGLVMTTEAAASAHAAEIGYKSLQLQFESVTNRISGAFIPALVGIEQNLTTVFQEAVGEANAGLNRMGGSGGFLATVAAAMGTGNTAIEAQTALYEDLKAALIAVAQFGIEPVITAMGFVMTEFNAAKVIFGDVRQIIDGVRLSFLGLRQAMSLGLLPGSVDLTQWKALDQQMADLELKMFERGKALQADKQAEQDWGAWATKATHEVEEAVNILAKSHTNAAEKIAEFAARSHTAYGGVGADVEGSTKAVDKYAKEWEKNDTEVQKIWGEAFVAQQRIDKESLTSHLNVLEQERQNDLDAAAERIAETTKSADQYHALEFAINAKYAALEHDAELAALKKIEDDKSLYSLKAIEELGASKMKASQKQFEAEAVAIGKQQFADQNNRNITTHAYEDMQAAIEKGALSSTDYQILQVQRWQNDAEGKIDYTRDTWIAAYAAIGLEAQVKIREIMAAQDPLLQAFRHINDDMKNTWAKTWEQALSGAISFGQAFQDTLVTSLWNPFKNILAGMLADFEQILLKPILDELQSLERSFVQYLVRTGLVAAAGGGEQAVDGGGSNIYGNLLNTGESAGTKWAYGAIASHFAATAGSSAAFVGPIEAGSGMTSATAATFNPATVYGAGTSASTAGGGAGLAGSLGVAGGIAGAATAGWLLGSYLGNKTESKPEGAAMGAGAGAAAGAAIGSVVPGVGTGIGAAAGAIAGAIAGWRAAGHLYEEVKTQQADLMKQLGGMDAEIKNVGDAYALTGHSGEEAQKALHAMWDAKTPEEFAKAVKPVAEALQALQQNTADLQAATTDATGRISEAWKRVIDLNTKYGSNTKEVTAFIQQQAGVVVSGFLDVEAAQLPAIAGYDLLKKAVDDAQASVDALLKSGKGGSELDRALGTLATAKTNQAAAGTLAAPELGDLGTMAVGAYATSVASGSSRIDAVKGESDALTALEQEYKDLGIAVTDVGLKSLFTTNDMMKASGTLMTGVSGLTKSMVGLDNIGLETKDTFAAQQRTGEQMYTRLQAAADATAKANGDLSDQTAAALLPMQDYLHQAAIEAEKLHVPLDALTQQMIDQSKDAGIWKDDIKPPPSVQDAIQLLADTVDDLARALRGLPPNVHTHVTVDTSTTGTGTGTGTPPPTSPEASGGFGFASGPMTFTTQGNEQYAFSGEGKSFSTGALGFLKGDDPGPGLWPDQLSPIAKSPPSWGGEDGLPIGGGVIGRGPTPGGTSVYLTIQGWNGTDILRTVRSPEFAEALVSATAQNKSGLYTGMRGALGVS